MEPVFYYQHNFLYADIFSPRYQLKLSNIMKEFPTSLKKKSNNLHSVKIELFFSYGMAIIIRSICIIHLNSSIINLHIGVCIAYFCRTFDVFF